MCVHTHMLISENVLCRTPKPYCVWSAPSPEYESTVYGGCQPCSWSAEQRKWTFPCPRSRLRIWSRETGSTVPSRVSLLILHTQAETDAYSRDSSRFPRRRPFIYLNRHTPSGQPRVYRVTHFRTDGVHCREAAGTGPVNLKVVSVTGAALAGQHGPINRRYCRKENVHIE